MEKTQRVVAPRDLWVPALSRYVTEGEPVEVPSALAESLKAQGWTQPKTKKTKEKP